MHLYSLFVLLGIAGALAAPAKPHLIFVYRNPNHNTHQLQPVSLSVRVRLTDDQDLTLGSMDYMPKTTRLLGGDHGVVFEYVLSGGGEGKEESAT